MVTRVRSSEGGGVRGGLPAYTSQRLRRTLPSMALIGAAVAKGVRYDNVL